MSFPRRRESRLKLQYLIWGVARRSGRQTLDMIYTVYVLKDESKYTYTGCTSNLEVRIWEHNNKVTKSTRKGKNWKVVYTKDFNTKSEALRYERFLKTGKGRELLKTWGVV